MRLLVVSTLAAVCVLAFGSPAAYADGSPDISADVSSSVVLYGNQPHVTVTAANPPGTYGYNLSFRVVLPAGVTYAGGASVAPREIIGQPAAGQRTLIFENVSDLSPGSSRELGFDVAYSNAAYDAGDAFAVTAQAFLNSDPRYVPKFTATGTPNGPSATSYTGYTPPASGTQSLKAIEVRKSEPSPEGEILRGVHDHQTVYTLTVANNGVRPTTGTVLEDYLPAGLEFLGCGGPGADHTTDAPTNPGSAEEYPGAGPITVPALGGCTAPLSVATETVDPDGPVGPLPNGVYTHVTWSVGTLAAGGSQDFTYRAAVPMRANTMTFSGSQPAAASLGQATNLDNNSGPEVTDETALRNHATVTGTYQGTTPRTVSDATTLTRTAEDWVVRKSGDSSGLAQGALTNWTLTFETGEYKFADDATVTDTLPNGLCPLDATNRTSSNHASDGECDPVVGRTPSAPYTSATENADGTWTLVWDKSTFAALAHTDVNDTFTLTFPTRTRQRYQSNFLPTTPILTRDAITNTVATSASGFARCLGPGNADCAGGGTRIAHDGVDGSPIPDASSAGQVAGDPTIDKRVAASGTDCQLASYVTTVPHYHPGDRICWKLRVEFPGALDTSPQAVADYLPAGVSYEAGSEAVTADNTVTATVDETRAADGLLTWTVAGGTVPTGSRVFERVISTIAQPPGTAVNGDVVGNLLKFSSLNTASVSVPLRDQADYVLDTPVVGLTKGVERIVRGATTVNGPNGPNVDNRTVKGGDEVTYRVDVSNTGAQDALDVEVWDLLPAEYPCPAAVAAISDSGACGAADRVEWTIPTLAAGATKTLTYTATVPDDIGPGRALDNAAGVRGFQGATNLGTRFDYRPASNIDGAATPANAPAADDGSRVTAADATVTKTHTTSVTEGGNTAAQATIGEDITYTVTATVPEGSELGGAVALTDTVDSTTRQPYVSGTATATFNGGALPVGFTLDTSGTVPRVVFPNDYANAPGSGDDVVVLVFTTRVADVAGNTAASGNLTNQAALTWTDPVDGAQTRNSTTVSTQVVEPLITQAKTDDKNPARVEPDDIVTYTVTTTNSAAARTSTAHDVVISDAVPVGLTPIAVAPGNAALADGATVPGTGGAVWDADTRTIVKTVATIAPGGSSAFSYRARVDNPAIGGSSLTNTVSATAASLGSAATGRRTSGTRYAANANDTIQIGGATVTKSGLPTTATIGAPVTYTVRVTIPAGISLYDVTVTDVVPDSIDVDGYGAETCVSGCPLVNTIGRYTPVVNGNGTTTIAWDLGDLASPLAVAQVIDLSYSGHVRATHRNGGANVVAAQTAVNSVTVASNRSNLDGAFSPATIPTGFDDTSTPATSTTTVVEPAVTVDKVVKVAAGAFTDGPATAQSDDGLTYRVVVRNTGTAPALDVTVTDLPDAELTGIVPTAQAGVTVTDGWSAADRDLTWQIAGPIAPGADVTLTYTAALVSASTLSDGQAIDNTAAVPHYFGVPAATRGANPGTVYRDYTDGGSDTTSVVVDFPTFAVVKTTGAGGFPDTGNAEVGQPFAWRVVVTNTSTTATATDVHVTDTLPDNWSYVTGSANLSEPSIAGSTLDWTIASLAPGASATITYSARPLLAAATSPGLGAGAHVNGARVTAAEDEAGNAGNADGPYESTPDTATATLRVPTLTLAKTPDHGAATAGDASSFTLTITNTGAVTARDLDISDVLPAGLAYTGGAATASPAGGFSETSRAAGPGAGETTVHWRVATLAAGASVTVTVPVAVDSGLTAGTTLTNTASVESDETPGPVSDTGSLDVTTGTDVSIAKSGAATYTPGANYTWHLRVRNHGPSSARAAAVSDTLPAGTTFVSADAPCVHAGGTVTCTPGTLAVGADVTYDVVVAVDPALTVPTLSNTATVSTTTPDADPSNDSSTFGPTVAPLADVSVTKTASPSAPLEGYGTSFTLTVHNAGPSVARAVTLTDVLPAELPFASVDNGGCAHAAGTVSCALGDLAPGADVVIRVAVSTGILGTFTNTATVATTTPEPPGGGAPNSAQADVTVRPIADLALAKTAPPTVAAGGALTWQLTVTNHGPRDATGVTISDPLPAGTTFSSADPGCGIAAGVVTCAVGALANGASASRSVTVTVPHALAGTTVLNTATVRADQGDDDPSDDTATATTQVGPSANLAIVKSGPAAVEAGGTVAWTLAVSNAGPSTATAVRVIDTLPSGVELVGATPTQGSCAAAGGTVECSLATLPSGAAVQIQVVARVPAALEGATLVNRASVAGEQPDPNPADDASSSTTRVDPPARTGFDLALVKAVAGSAKPQLGAPLRYTLTVSNAGPATATAVKLVDTLPGSVEYASAALPGGKCAERAGVVTCTLGALAPGATAQATVTVRPVRGGTVRNTATVSSAMADRDPANDRSTATVEVEEQPAALSIVKTAVTKGVVAAGGRIRLKIRVKNTSPHAAADVIVCDDPGTTTYVKTAGARFRNGRACWTVGVLAAGASRTYTVTVRVNRRTSAGTLRAGATVKAGNARTRRDAAKIRVKPGAAAGRGAGGVTG
ncbi:DUF11 domain-containing protein [Solirubrobacter sp. CPCC 204708]|uniref:DUF11 domain-containing protein n=1 Tax=Solirubrobacter deserti TaxID=2282478 RepID=A0ABT4RC51_9ACTN|nr:DUF11 domain-containing protein [Solirubrobacter deserti]MBE2317197.1 DUF11 domain-containing protein [Solirubrobacter deserti]MDA0135910.1 DUF11 domain-containing protein [Solirubrobacter deserti]